MSSSDNKSNGSTLKIPSSDNSNNVIGNQATTLKTTAHNELGETYCGSQHSANSIPSLKNKCPEERTITTVDEIIARLVEPTHNKISTEVADDIKGDEGFQNVNIALCNLQLKENTEQVHTPSTDNNKAELKDKGIHMQTSCNNSASFDHLLHDDTKNAAAHFDTHSSRGPNEHKVNNFLKKILQMYATEHHKRPMPCLQRYQTPDKQHTSYININHETPSTHDLPKLSSQTRVRSFSSEAEESYLDKMNIEDFKSSQDSPEMVCLGEKKTRAPSISQESDEEVFIGQHRLSPIRKKKSERIDDIYNETIVSNQTAKGSSSSMSQYKTPLPPRRFVQPSKYLSSPFGIDVCSYEPTDLETQYYQSIVRLANMQQYKHEMAIEFDNCRVTMETFGNSMKVRGVVESWVINLYSRILFRENHPKDSNRHTFFHTSSEYFLEKAQTEGRRLIFRNDAIKAFEGVGKARKLHLTESLHFPSLYYDHWFLFSVDIRDNKFIFMDSYFDKDSLIHKEVDDRMIKNFKEIWNASGQIKVDFTKFESVYPKVPQQDNNKDWHFCNEEY